MSIEWLSLQCIIYLPLKISGSCPAVMLSSNPDVVALWEVSLPDGIHLLEFEHETTSGRRVVR